mmetsp:Transcript_27841/g.46567  ORF Transcript_27841/g.46567 Transcript_27841/m.46567 type:complete len:209 (-) Transcript_27841:311-937(-)
MRRTWHELLPQLFVHVQNVFLNFSLVPVLFELSPRRSRSRKGCGRHLERSAADRKLAIGQFAIRALWHPAVLRVSRSRFVPHPHLPLCILKKVHVVDRRPAPACDHPPLIIEPRLFAMPPSVELLILVRLDKRRKVLGAFHVVEIGLAIQNLPPSLPPCGLFVGLLQPFVILLQSVDVFPTPAVSSPPEIRGRGLELGVHTVVGVMGG